MKRTQGFTLVEMLLYTAIAASVALASVALLRILEDYRIRAFALADMTQEASVAMERLTGIVHEDAVTIPVPGGWGAVLETDGGITVSAVDGVLTRTGTAGTARLHGESVSLIEVSFENLSSSSAEPIVRVHLTLAASLSGGTFAPGASLSRTYDTFLTTFTK